MYYLYVRLVIYLTLLQYAKHDSYLLIKMFVDIKMEIARCIGKCIGYHQQPSTVNTGLVVAGVALRQQGRALCNARGLFLTLENSLKGLLWFGRSPLFIILLNLCKRSIDFNRLSPIHQSSSNTAPLEAVIISLSTYTGTMQISQRPTR